MPMEWHVYLEWVHLTHHTLVLPPRNLLLQMLRQVFKQMQACLNFFFMTPYLPDTGAFRPLFTKGDAVMVF